MRAYVAIPVTQLEVVDLKRKYHPKSSTPPHLTLLPPGNLLVAREEAADRFRDIKIGSVAPRSVGAGYFGEGARGVVYLDIEKSRELDDLRTQVRWQLIGALSNKNIHGEFNPHLTIAKFTTASRLQKLLEELVHENTHFDLPVGRLALYAREQRADPWQEIASVEPSV